jgi:hypothetical protein
MNQGNKKSTPWFESEAGYEAYAKRIGSDVHVAEDCDQPGLWAWITGSDGIQMSAHSALEAWRDWATTIDAEMDDPILTRTITVPKAEAERLQAILEIDSFDDITEDVREELLIEDDAVLFEEDVVFEDGFSASIGVYTGQSNAWVGACLYDKDGHTVGECEPSETLLGEAVFEFEGKTYKVLAIVRP